MIFQGETQQMMVWLTKHTRHEGNLCRCIRPLDRGIKMAALWEDISTDFNNRCHAVFMFC